MFLKGTHKPLIHPPLAPAATQGLFLYTCVLLAGLQVTDRLESGRSVTVVRQAVWYPPLLMRWNQSFNQLVTPNITTRGPQ
jgi:hypothetical protein